MNKKKVLGSTITMGMILSLTGCGILKAPVNNSPVNSTTSVVENSTVANNTVSNNTALNNTVSNNTIAPTNETSSKPKTTSTTIKPKTTTTTTNKSSTTSVTTKPKTTTTTTSSKTTTSSTSSKSSTTSNSSGTSTGTKTTTSSTSKNTSTTSSTVSLNPPLPSGTTTTQYNSAVSETEKTSNNSTSLPTSYSALSSSTQWYNNPSDIFYDKQFPVSKLKNGTVLQSNPYVIVSTTDGKNTNNMGYVYVLEYVGYGLNATGTPSTYWKEEQVYTNNGKMFTIVPNVQSFMVASNSIGGYPDLKKPSSVSGINFGSNDPANPAWAVGGGTDAIPILGWKPLK